MNLLHHISSIIHQEKTYSVILIAQFCSVRYAVPFDGWGETAMGLLQSEPLI